MIIKKTLTFLTILSILSVSISLKAQNKEEENKSLKGTTNIMILDMTKQMVFNDIPLIVFDDEKKIFSLCFIHHQNTYIVTFLNNYKKETAKDVFINNLNKYKKEINNAEQKPKIAEMTVTIGIQFSDGNSVQHDELLDFYILKENLILGASNHEDVCMVLTPENIDQLIKLCNN